MAHGQEMLDRRIFVWGVEGGAKASVAADDPTCLRLEDAFMGWLADNWSAVDYGAPGDVADLLLRLLAASTKA